MTDPYYQDDHVTLYHGDCFKLLEHLDFDVIVTDPPYGIALKTDYAQTHSAGKWSRRNTHKPVAGDHKPFDPGLFLRYPCAMFGANHYSQHVPSNATWHIWDKRDGVPSDLQADAEMWFTTWPSGPTRVFRYMWRGFQRPVGAETGHLHPTQKPLSLMRHILNDARTPAGVVLDPFAGSGSTLRAAKDLGRQAIGIELEEQYCEVIVDRLSQEVLPL